MATSCCDEPAGRVGRTCRSQNAISGSVPSHFGQMIKLKPDLLLDGTLPVVMPAAEWLEHWQLPSSSSAHNVW